MAVPAAMLIYFFPYFFVVGRVGLNGAKPRGIGPSPIASIASYTKSSWTSILVLARQAIEWFRLGVRRCD
jgi:hypothetical protein